MSKICPNCNSECSDYVSFCTNCGTSLADVSKVVDVEATVVDENSTYGNGIDDMPEAPKAPEAPQPQFSGYDSADQNVYQGEPQMNYMPQNNEGSQALAIVSLVLGILSLLCCCCRWAGVVMSIAAIVCGIIVLVNHKRGKGMAIAGIVCGGIGVLVALTLIIISASSLAMLNNLDYSDIDSLVESLIEDLDYM